MYTDKMQENIQYSFLHFNRILTENFISLHIYTFSPR